MLRSGIRVRTLFILFVLALAVSPCLAEPQGSVDLAEALPPSEDLNQIECRPVSAAITGVETDPNHAVLSLRNGGTKRAPVVLLVLLTVDGLKRLVWADVTISGKSAQAFEIRYLGNVTASQFKVCANRPIGVIDALDPVAQCHADAETTIE